MGPVGAARQRREDAHHAAAFGAGGNVAAGPRGRGVGCRGLEAVHLLGQSGSAEREVGGAAAVGEEAEVPVRWKRSGSMCRRKRRMNSSGASFMTLTAPSWR